MKSTVLGLLVGMAATTLVATGWANRNYAVAQRGEVTSGELITVSTMIGDKGQTQQLTLIDPQKRVMSVYHVEPTTEHGRIHNAPGDHTEERSQYIVGPVAQ